MKILMVLTWHDQLGKTGRNANAWAGSQRSGFIDRISIQ